MARALAVGPGGSATAAWGRPASSLTACISVAADGLPARAGGLGDSAPCASRVPADDMARDSTPLIVGGIALAALAGGAALFGKRVYRYVTFEPERTLPDVAIFPYRRVDISALFEREKSYLRRLGLSSDTTLGARTLPAGTPLSAVIDYAAATNGINPAWILVRLQAEQSLISLSDELAAEWRRTPRAWVEGQVWDKAAQRYSTPGTRIDSDKLTYALRWALGYGVFEPPLGAQTPGLIAGAGYRPPHVVERFAGIERQIWAAADWTRRRIEMERGNLGRPQSVDCKTWAPESGCTQLVPKTIATRIAYAYTPRTEAARSTQAIYRRHFPDLLTEVA